MGLKSSGVTILQGVEFSVFLLIFCMSLTAVQRIAVPVISQLGDEPVIGHGQFSSSTHQRLSAKTGFVWSHDLILGLAKRLSPLNTWIYWTVSGFSDVDYLFTQWKHAVYYCYYIFTMGGQLRLSLCLSGNPPLCLLQSFSATYILLYCGD